MSGGQDDRLEETKGTEIYRFRDGGKKEEGKRARLIV